LKLVSPIFYRRWTIIDFPNQFTEKKDILKDIPEIEFNNLATKCVVILKNLSISRFVFPYWNVYPFHNLLNCLNQNLSKSELKAWEDMMDADLDDLHAAHPELKEKNDKDSIFVILSYKGRES